MKDIKNVIIVILSCGIVLLFAILSIDNSNKTSKLTEAKETVYDTTKVEFMSELDYYKKLYEVELKKAEAIEGNYKIFLGVAFGIIVTFGALILGSQAFINYRSNEKRIVKVENKFEKRLNKKANKIGEAFEKETESIDEKISVLNSKVETTSKEIDKNLKKVKALEVKVSDSEERNAQFIAESIRKHNLLSFEYSSDLAKRYYEKKILDHAIINQVDALESLQIMLDEHLNEYRGTLFNLNAYIQQLIKLIYNDEGKVTNNRFKKACEKIPLLLHESEDANVKEIIEIISDSINKLNFQTYGEGIESNVRVTLREGTQPII